MDTTTKYTGRQPQSLEVSDSVERFLCFEPLFFRRGRWSCPTNVNATWNKAQSTGETIVLCLPNQESNAKREEACYKTAIWWSYRNGKGVDNEERERAAVITHQASTSLIGLADTWWIVVQQNTFCKSDGCNTEYTSLMPTKSFLTHPLNGYWKRFRFHFMTSNRFKICISKLTVKTWDRNTGTV